MRPKFSLEEMPMGLPRKGMSCGGYYCSGEYNLGNEEDIDV